MSNMIGSKALFAEGISFTDLRLSASTGSD